MTSSSPPSGRRSVAPPPAPRASAPPVSRLGRLARLGALAPRALPIAAEAVRRAVGARRTEEEELEARRRVLAEREEDRRGDAQDARRDERAAAQARADGVVHRRPRAARLRGEVPARSGAPAAEGAARSRRRPRSRSSARTSARTRRRSSREWESEPFAAASIGQVHRAVTRGGERVAVKVQYPGIDKAIENDLKSLSLLESMIAPIGRRYQTQGDARRDPRRLPGRARLPARGRDGRRRSAASTRTTPTSSSRASSTRSRRGACSRSSSSAASTTRRSASARPQADRNAAGRDDLRASCSARSGSTASSTPTRTPATTASSAAGASRSSTSAATSGLDRRSSTG